MIASSQKRGLHAAEPAQRRRLRACQPCRNMKIRCNRLPGQEACKACANVNRACVAVAPSQPRRPAALRVAELEQKIDALTKSLESGDRLPTSPVHPSTGGFSCNNSADSGMAVEPPSSETQTPGTGGGGDDVISRGTISPEVAARILNRFIVDLDSLAPTVSLPEDISLSYLRRDRPLLLGAIFAVASGTIVPQLQPGLALAFARDVASRAMFYTEKSVDLLQAMLVYATWHLKHRESRDIGFGVYVRSATLMAMDLGLGDRSRVALEQGLEAQAELRRTWLCCYHAALSVSIFLRQPPLIRFSPYIQECLSFFSDYPATSRADIQLCSFVRLAQLLENVSMVFSMADEDLGTCIDDPRTQYHLKIFNRRLAEWREAAGQGSHPSFLEHSFHIARLYIHEIALHDTHKADTNRPTPPGSLTTAHFDALTICVCSMNGAADSFLAMSQATSPLLDCRFLGGVLYACVAMVQVSGLLRIPGPKWADVFLPDLRVNYYLDAVIQKLDAMSRLDANPSAQGYSRAFQRLREWRHRRWSGGASSTITGLIGEIRDGLLKPAGTAPVVVREAEGEAHGEMLATPDTALQHLDGMDLVPAQQSQSQSPFDAFPGGSRSEEEEEDWNSFVGALGDSDPLYKNISIWFDQ